MTRPLLVLASFALLLSACGGGTAAALNATVFPGDRDVTGRRLESLARQYEREYGCTEADTITINGLAPAVYHVEGCSHIRDYTLFCRPGAYGQICEWVAFDDLTVRAGADLSCDPAAIDVQVIGPLARMVTGCGFRASYVARCSGATCPWILNSRVEPAGPAVGGNGGYTY